jgi:hypothetical protein
MRPEAVLQGVNYISVRMVGIPDRGLVSGNRQAAFSVWRVIRTEPMYDMAKFLSLNP